MVRIEDEPPVLYSFARMNGMSLWFAFANNKGRVEG